MTRTGKIARLSADLLDELNVRLENGQEGAPLLKWLNGLEEVQEILANRFHGSPITKQNLSEWRLGGFRQWQVHQELIGQARRLSDDASTMEKDVDTYLLPGALARVLAARYAALLNDWDGEPDPKFEQKLALFRSLSKDIALLQKTMHLANLQEREFEQASEERAKREKEKEKEYVISPFMAKMESDATAAVLGGGEHARQMADFLAAVKYDLPTPIIRPHPKQAAEAQQPESARPQPASKPPLQIGYNSVQPSPTQSNQIQPSPTGQDPVQPGQTEPDQVSPSPTQSSPVKPVLAASESSDPPPATSKEGD